MKRLRHLSGLLVHPIKLNQSRLLEALLNLRDAVRRLRDKKFCDQVTLRLCHQIARLRLHELLNCLPIHVSQNLREQHHEQMNLDLNHRSDSIFQYLLNQLLKPVQNLGLRFRPSLLKACFCRHHFCQQLQCGLLHLLQAIPRLIRL